MFCSRHSLVCMILLSALAQAQAPLEDVGFSSLTGFPDPDLVVVRERSYSVPGVDLGAYGIGGGRRRTSSPSTSA